MDETLVLKRNEITGNSDFDHGRKGSLNVNDRIGKNPSSARLLNECGLNLFLYLRSLNLSDEKEVIVLPANHHFFFDREELQKVRVLINLKSINLIRKPDKFLDNLVSILPADANFVGCFSDSKSMNREISGKNRSSVIFNRVLNFLDSRTDNSIDRNEVSELLGKSGFRIMDIKEINGLTYFNCRKERYLKPAFTPERLVNNFKSA